MNIHVYTLTWNEERMLPWFLAHYEQFADKIIVMDNESTDRTLEIAEAHPKVELQTYSSNEQIRDDLYLRIKNSIWKGYRGEADYHIVVDADEFLWHRTRPMRSVIEQAYDDCIDVLAPKGYQMFAPAFPEYREGEQLIENILTGAPSHWYDKMVAFNNDTIDSMNYAPGCHQATPMVFTADDGCCADGITIHRDPDLRLLHFKYVHELAYMKERIAQYASRLSDINKRNGWGHQYAQWDKMLAERNEIIRGIRPIREAA